PSLPSVIRPERDIRAAEATPPDLTLRLARRQRPGAPERPAPAPARDGASHAGRDRRGPPPDVRPPPGADRSGHRDHVLRAGLPHGAAGRPRRNAGASLCRRTLRARPPRRTGP